MGSPRRRGLPRRAMVSRALVAALFCPGWGNFFRRVGQFATTPPGIVVAPVRHVPRLSIRRTRMPLTSKLPWAVILAGGDGIRLRPLTQRLTGDARPKQFCRLFG